MTEASYDNIEKNPPLFFRIREKLPQESGKSNSFIMFTESGTEYLMQLLSKNRYHAAIFEALRAGVNSEWFSELSLCSQSNQSVIIHPFIKWINEDDTSRKDSNRYACLVDYNIFRKNQVGVKTGTISRLKTIILNGMRSANLSAADIHYLEILLRMSKAPPDEEATGHSLTRWFAQFDLRTVMGDEDFLRLESPRLLISSFRVTIAVTLSYILECRDVWRQRPEIQITDAQIYSVMNKMLLLAKGSFNEDGRPNDNLTKLLLADLVIPRMYSDLEGIIKNGELAQINAHFKSRRIWQRPRLFSSEFGETYSHLEQVLAAWLIACLGVQPTDILKLKPNNIAKEFNSKGRLILMQIKYYKGRAGYQKETDLMLSSDSWTKALYQYLIAIPANQRIFEANVNESMQLPSIKGDKHSTMVGMLMRMWDTPELQQRLATEFNRAQTTDLFLKGMRAVAKRHIDDVQRKVTHRVGKGFVRPYLFKLGHIKTSAIHAGSDRYRESDLINHHSHTSETEKHNYLTDENKDWVNQCGRITRLVLHDLQNVVYQPSVDQLRSSVAERLSKTRLTDTLVLNGENVRDIRTSQVGEINFDDRQDLMISDSVDSALYFIHYIAQAEEVFETLNRFRPEFVERTLIVQIEWMTVMLSKMQSAGAAQSQYVAIKHHLPPVFNHLMESHE